MARTAGKKQAPAKIEEEDDADGWEDAVVEADGKDGGADLRLRDWRDVERFREMKELRSLVDDDYGLEEIFHVPLKSRVEVPPRQPKTPPPAKGGKGAKPAPAPAPVPAAPPKGQAKAPAPPAKPAPKKAAAKPAPQAKAKAKRK